MSVWDDLPPGYCPADFANCEPDLPYLDGDFSGGAFLEFTLIAILDRFEYFLHLLAVSVSVALLSMMAWTKDAINGVLGALRKVAGLLAKPLQYIWQHLIRGILLRLANALIAMHRWLEDHLGPVIRFLQRLRAFIDRIFRRYIRPILVLLQRVRRVLAVFRLLGFKWAQALDARIAQIEGKIAQVVLTIRGTLNAVIDVVNALSDPPRLVRLIAISVAGRRAAAGLVRIFTGLPIGFFLPNYRSDAPPWEKPVLTSKDLTDPARNPLGGTLFDSLLPSPITPFIGVDPMPTTDDLNRVDPFPYYTDLLAFMEAGEQDQQREPIAPGTLADAIQSDAGAYYISGQEMQLSIATG